MATLLYGFHHARYQDVTSRVTDMRVASAWLCCHVIMSMSGQIQLQLCMCKLVSYESVSSISLISFCAVETQQPIIS